MSPAKMTKRRHGSVRGFRRGRRGRGAGVAPGEETGTAPAGPEACPPAGAPAGVTPALDTGEPACEPLGLVGEHAERAAGGAQVRGVGALEPGGPAPDLGTAFRVHDARA